MTQNDIDAGRVIASVSFQAALPIERITVHLALDEGGDHGLEEGGAHGPLYALSPPVVPEVEARQ